MNKPYALKVIYWGTTGSYPRWQMPHERRAYFTTALIALQQEYPDATLTEIVAQLQSGAGDQAPRFPAAHSRLFGGNTTCIELATNTARFLIDAGSGLQSWDAARTASAAARGQTSGEPTGRPTYLLLTHAHWDHLCGLPFAESFYDPQANITVLAAPSVVSTLRQLLDAPPQRTSRLLSVTFRDLVGIHEVLPLEIGSTVEVDGVAVSTLALNHPGDAVAYRFDICQRRVVIATDHEHRQSPDTALGEFAASADLLYLDAQYTQREYDGEIGVADEAARSRRGWGHSTVESCVLTALAARAKRLHLGHHDPRRTPDKLQRLADYAREFAQVTDKSATLEIELALEDEQWTID